MSTKEIKALCRRFAEEVNKGEAAAMAVMDEMFSPDFIFHSGTGEDVHGLEVFKKQNSEFFRACPDLHFSIDDMIVEGDKVATRWTLTGTQKGAFAGIPATNKKRTISALYIDRLAGGKFAEEWERYDTLGMMQQLGLK